MKTNVWKEAKSKVSCLEEAVASSEDKSRGRKREEEGRGREVKREREDRQTPAGLRARGKEERALGHSRRQSPLRCGSGFALSCSHTP